MAFPSEREGGKDPTTVGPKVHDDEELLLFDSSELTTTQASISAQEVTVLGVYRGSMSPVEETTMVETILSEMTKASLVSPMPSQKPSPLSKKVPSQGTPITSQRVGSASSSIGSADQAAGESGKQSAKPGRSAKKQSGAEASVPMDTDATYHEGDQEEEDSKDPHLSRSPRKSIASDDEGSHHSGSSSSDYEDDDGDDGASGHGGPPRSAGLV